MLHVAPSNTSASPRNQRNGLEVALIFIVFFVAGGAPVPHVNETHYLAKAKHYWQPDWCAGDLFLESGKAHVTFYWTVGLLTKWLSLPTVAWIGRAVAWLALAFAWQRLSRSVVGLSLGAVISSMLLVALIDWTNFAGEWVIGGVEGKCFAYALVFWGLSALAVHDWRTVWLSMGLAGVFHVLVGGWSVIAAAMVWLWQPRGERPTLRSMLPALLLGGVLALPGVIPALQLTQAVSPETVEQANQIYVFDRLPHHLSPLTLRESELGKKALRFGLLLLGFAWLRYFCSQQPARPEPGATPGRSWPFHGLDLIMRFALAALVVSVAGLAWELATWNHPSLAARLLKYYPFRLADIALPVATSLGIGWFIHHCNCRRSNWGVVLLILSILLPCWHLLNLGWARYENPRPPADRKVKNLTAFREACEWSREHSSTDALFLVPRGAQSFKWYAHRSDLVTWKDVPQNAADLVTWHRRFFDVHWHYDAENQYVPYGSLAKQGTQRIRDLAEKYAFDYLLTRDYPPLDLPVVFKNRYYTIYAVGDESPE